MKRIPDTWWCSIDKKHTSYEEFKDRQVIAYGWPQLGTLASLCKPVYDKNSFQSLIRKLGDEKAAGLVDQKWWKKHKSYIRKVPLAIWNLLNLRAGDLVVGIEGITVRGICELAVDGRVSYQYQEGFNYAHTVGYPVHWVDWNGPFLNLPPEAPRQSVHGIRGLQQRHAYVIKCWQAYLSSTK
jgi:hypothetical protein